ncbi:MAG TPA: GNAT family N-acetyltransferase [Lactobacillus sp.]|nr:GNAT family N-acetyltransferase [Lactobacillus sp.]
MRIESAKTADLEQIEAIEQAGFNAAEAASLDTYRERLATLPDTFLVARADDGHVLGFIVGPAVKERYVADWMYEDTPKNLPTGGHQLVFTIAMAPETRGQGIGSKLLTALAEVATKAGRESMSLTCLADRIPFYEKNGYVNAGVADSQHADEVWFNMEKDLKRSV